MPEIILVRRRWEPGPANRWNAPAPGVIDSIPLSSRPEAALPGPAPSGWGLCTYPDGTTVPGALALGRDMDRVLSAPQKAEITARLGIAEPLEGATLRDNLWSVLTVHADGRGLTRPKPLVPTAQGFLEMHLGGFSSLRRRLDKTGVEWPKVLEVIKDNYVRCPPGMRRKVLGAWRAKYRVTDHRIFLPPGEPDPGFERPSTALADLFETDTSANWTADNGTFTIDAADSGFLEPTAVLLRVRYNTLLSTDDHWSKIIIAARGGDTNSVMARKPASATIDMYMASLQGANPFEVFISETINGTQTILGAFIADTYAATDRYEVRCNGSTIDFWKNEALVATRTATNITGNLAVGLTSNSVTCDIASWSAEDLAAAAAFSFSGLTLVGVG